MNMVSRLVAVAVACASAFAAFPARADSLLAHWPFTDGSLEDVSGNGHTLTNGEAVVTSAGYLHFPENAAEDTSWAQTTNTVTMSGSQTATVSLWLRKPNPANSTTLMELTDMSLTPAKQTGSFSVDYTTGKQVSLIYYAAQSNYKNTRVSSAGLFDDDEWHFIAATINISTKNTNPTVNLYVDGKLDSTSTATAKTGKNSYDTFKNDKFYFARRKGDAGSGGSFAGDMDEIAVYGNVLTSASVQTNYYRQLGIVYGGDSAKYQSRLPDGYRVDAEGVISYRVRVISNHGVKFGEGEFKTGTNEYWVVENETVAFLAQTPATAERLAWSDVPKEATFTDGGLSMTFVVVQPETIYVDAFTPTHVWTGSASTDFAADGNWNDAQGNPTTAPSGPDASVFIPCGAENQPIASSGISVGEFRIGRLFGTTGSATFSSKTTATHLIARTCRIYAGGQLTHEENGSLRAYVLDLKTMGDMVIADGGSVNVEKKGFKGNAGEGVKSGGKASYGGAGAVNIGRCYGSIRRPTDLGSGNGDKGYGSGAIKLDVAGTLLCDGTISADLPDRSGGVAHGSAGSVWMIVSTLTGHGRISAKFTNVGATRDDGAAAGRIALIQRTATDISAFDGSLDVTSAYNYSSGAGGPGSLYIENANDERDRGELIVDGGGKYKCGEANYNGCELLDRMADEDVPFRKITIRNKGAITIESGVVVRTVDLEVSADSVITGGGVLELMSQTGQVSRLNASFTLGGLICTNAGAQVEVAEGNAVTIAPGGVCWLSGEEDDLVRLTSSGAWTLNLPSDADAQIRCVAVSNCNAAVSSVSDIGGEDLGGNVNWSFPPMPKAGARLHWAGGGSTEWGVGDNWLDEQGNHRPPLSTDIIVIGSDKAPYPEVTADQTMQKLVICAGASVVLSGANLNVTDSLSCTGRLACVGTEFVTVSGSVEFPNGGVFEAGNSTFVLSGTESQGVNFASNALYDVRVECPAVTFTTGFSAYDFSCEQPQDVALVFAAGELFDVRVLHLVPASETEGALTLDSTAAGTAWRLKAGAGALCDGVSVRDCDASAGNAICTVDFIDRTNNTNWRSGAARWTGAVDSTWENAENWSDGAVPTNTTDVFIGAGANAPTLNADTCVRSFTVKGADGSTTVTLNGRLAVAEFAYVGQDATVVVNKRMSVTNDFMVADGGLLTHEANGTADRYHLELYVGGNMTVESLGKVSADDKGLCGDSGKGDSSGTYSSASYGGAGNGTARQCYGSIRAPVDLGSGNGESRSTVCGGGAVKLEVEGILELNGSVSADMSYANGGVKLPGAGSVWIVAGKLVGGGVVSAVPATGSNNRTGGAGRISLVQTQATAYEFAGDMNVRAVDAAGGPGTLYIENAGDEPGYGELVVDGGNKYVPAERPGCEFTELMTDTHLPFRKVTVKNKGVLTIYDGCALRTHELVVDGSSKLSGAGTLEIIAQPNFVAKVSGDLSVGIGAFVCTNGAGTVEFAKGTAVTVAANGLLNLNGQVDRGLRLKSSEDGQPWYLTVCTGSTIVAKCLDVSDSDASEGMEIATRRSVGKRARNVHWKFTTGFALIVR